MKAELHPDDLDLMDYVDGYAREGVSTHLVDCLACREAVGQMADPVSMPDWASVSSSVNARVSASVIDALDRPLPADVLAGQLWRGRWDDDTQLVYVVSVQGPSSTLAPVALDLHLADPGVLRIDASRSPLGVAIGVWVRSRVDTRLSVLEQYLGPVTTDETDHASAHELAALDDRSIFTSRLRERLNLLAQRAAWEPKDVEDVPPLSSVLTQIGITLPDVIDLLEVATDVALDLWRGDEVLSPHQVTILDAEARRQGATILPSASVGRRAPKELFDELSLPVWKQHMLGRRADRSGGETETRRAAVAAARDLALAARSQRRSSTDWAEVLRRVVL